MSGKKNKRKRREERRQNSASTLSPQTNSGKKRRRGGDAQKKKSPKREDETPKILDMGNDNHEQKCLIFQDVMKLFLEQETAINKNDRHDVEEEVDEDGEISNTLFELANAPLVGFRVEPQSKDDTKRQDPSYTIVVKQDINACGRHTGGIVWETAYLLLQYLQTQGPLGKTLEVGAGCGMVGQVLAAQNMSVDNVVMTEHKDVVQNLRTNLERNQKQLAQHGAPIDVCELDWEHFERDVGGSKHLLEPHSCDTIVGTDVVFSLTLVEPLWKTLQYMSHSKTNIFLCLQERCTASHKLLLEKASEYGFDMKDITSHLDDMPACRWGTSLECRLFHVTRMQ